MPAYRQYLPLISILLLVSLLAAACSPAQAEPSGAVNPRIASVPIQYAADFAVFDNGHLVEHPFLNSYRAMQGERWLGRPIARPLQDAELGWRLQVYEFGLLAQDPTDNHVFLAKMSDLLGRRQPGVTATADSGCTYAQETGHNLCFNFREYVQASGPERFGLPVSEILMDSQGVMYQDFEYARLQWYGGGMDRERIGETFFYHRGYDRSLREPVAAVAGPAAGSTRLYASLARPTLRPGELQTLQAALTDPTGAGIPNVPLRVTLEQNGKAILEIALPATDEHGVSTLSFVVPDTEAGTRIRVVVRGMVGSENLEAVAEFEVWW